MVILETSIFTKQVVKLLTDDDYRQLQSELVTRSGETPPSNCGDRISMNDELFAELLESVKEGGAILRGEREASRRFVIAAPNVKQIREGYKLSQSEFAALLGVSIKTLQNWEQGRRTPQGAARVLLQVAAKHPNIVWEVVEPTLAPFTN